MMRCSAKKYSTSPVHWHFGVPITVLRIESARCIEYGTLAPPEPIVFGLNMALQDENEVGIIGDS